jgi:hypothetical protein
LDLEIEIKKKQAEAMKAETELGTKREASKTRRLLREKIEQEIERDKIENARNRFELDKSKLELALDLTARMQPDLSQADVMIRAVQMMPVLDTLATGDVEVRVLGTASESASKKDSRSVR